MEGKSNRFAPLVLASIAAIMGLALSGCGDALLLSDPRDLDIQVAAPVFTVPEGVHNTDLRVSISSPTQGAVIHYTSDGSDPTEAAPRFASADSLFITGNGTSRTIRAIAVKARLRPSLIVSASYVVRYDSAESSVAAPTIGPATCATRDSVTVTISQGRPGATVYYTTDGSSPLSSPTRIPYTGPFSIPWLSDSTTTVWTASSLPGGSDSPIASTTYSFLPPKIYVFVSNSSSNNKLWVSEDKGQNWKHVTSYTDTNRCNDIVATSQSVIYCASITGLMMTTNGGSNWVKLGASSGLPLNAGNIITTCIAVAPANDASGQHLRDTVYVGLAAHGLYVRSFNVQTNTWEGAWTQVIARSNATLLGATGTINDILIEGEDIYLATSFGFLKRVGGIWSSSTLNYAKTICRLGRFLILGGSAASLGGIRSSTDNGANWSLPSGGLDHQYSGSDSSYAYVGNYIGTDAGRSTPDWVLMSTWFNTGVYDALSPVKNFPSVGKGVVINERGLFLAGDTHVAMKLAGRNWFVSATPPGTIYIYGIAAP